MEKNIAETGKAGQGGLKCECQCKGIYAHLLHSEFPRASASSLHPTVISAYVLLAESAVLLNGTGCSNYALVIPSCSKVP